MEEDEIAALVPLGRAPPLKIRAVRSWNPPFRMTETCFLLVDKQGVAVQALAKGSEQRSVEARLRIGSCYLMQNYACSKLLPHCNVLTHSTNLIIGGATTFTAIPDNGEIPTSYFDFASRQRMERACDKEVEFIDYNVILINIENKLTTTEKPYVILKVKDCSNEIMYITLWEEIATSVQRFNRPIIQAAADPVIIGLTSLKVRSFNGKLKLQSSAATHVYLNPPSVETLQLRELAKRMLFVLHYAISPIKNGATSAAQNVPKELQQLDLNAVITDGTGSLNAKLYDDAVTQLIGIRCNELIEANPSFELSRIPHIINDQTGKELRLYIQVQRNDKTGNVKCTVSRIVHLQNTTVINSEASADITTKEKQPMIEAASETHAKEHSLSESTSNKPAEQLTAENEVTAQKHAIPTTPQQANVQQSKILQTPKQESVIKPPVTPLQKSTTAVPPQTESTKRQLQFPEDIAGSPCHTTRKPPLSNWLKITMH
ncbi:hypothetical protein QVD17_29694 [Tagetes erecta]|uniref:Uncharacterized protein n=1 Tax=Tagetes erecta TaxID=13708 RepID=A0AAD8NM92_TARER|nr:hypothetical protein QVD17_29694 [Tagetes erecta]